MDRELTEVKLPSGRVAKVVTFFTRGESRKINEMRWSGAVVKNNDEGQVVIENIPVTQQDIENDAIVLEGTKYIDGVEFNKELLDSMINTDYQFLLEKLVDVRFGKKK